MSSGDPTIPQDDNDQLRSQEMSLQRGYPPAQVPGYELEQFLGVGAFGEVWVAVERNTGRRVAIKFYAHRGGLDWSLLSREVEKLAFLFADRYVVQLIGVGWDADPPYYIMEYLERGSLAERLQQGPMAVAEAVEVFHEVAIGLLHAHGKGVLHCDLKPANVLLDQDNKPRLADFGQSRLSHEQRPALGTLFYMAPEQADLQAVPHARWDVYALGALLYCMLTGHPPHRESAAVEQIEEGGTLQQRLSMYRRLIRHSPPPDEHWKVAGVDRTLAEIIDGCLAADPHKRYPNVQTVLDALHARTVRRAQRPMVMLGAVGPVLLLVVVSLFAWWGFREALRRSYEALTQRAVESNHFAAQYVARITATELDARWRAVEQVASSEGIAKLMVQFASDAEMARLLDRLSNPKADPADLAKLQRDFREHPKRKAFLRDFDKLIVGRLRPLVNSWFINDARGVQLARIKENEKQVTVGRNLAWRSYFTGQDKDMPETWRPASRKEHIDEPTLSHVYLSDATNNWMVAVTAPIMEEGDDGKFLGIVGLTIEVGRFVELQGGDDQFAVLADWRDGQNKGVILQHPILNKLRNEHGMVPERFKEYRIQPDNLPDSPDRSRHYVDPMAADPQGAEFNRVWLAHSEPVSLRGRDTGWIILVQEAYDRAVGKPLERLKTRLIQYGLAALGMTALVMLGLWGFALRMLKDSLPRPRTTAIADVPSEPNVEGTPPDSPTLTFRK